MAVFRARPDKPGQYFWSEWDAVVEVTKRGQSLFVKPPATVAVEIKISRKIAGYFKLLEN